MNILHLVDERWDSGLTQYALHTAELLKKDGHRVVVGVLPDKKPAKLAAARGLETAPVDSLFKLRALLRGGWDVVNAHTGRMHTWAVLLAPRRIPVVRTRGDARAASANALSKLLYARTRMIIVASRHMADLYQEELGLPPEKIRVIYPSVEADAHFSPPPTDRVGILGRLDPVKGHAHFLEAAADVLKEHPSAKFLIAGKEANIGYDLLKNQANELGIGRSIDYLGYQPSALDFMRSCSLGVISSIGSEEVSRACLEWMSVGRPVVGTLVGSLPELIEPDETGLLVAPADGFALGEAVLKFLKDPARITACGKNAWESARRRFNSQTHLKETLETYRRAAGA